MRRRQTAVSASRQLTFAQVADGFDGEVPAKPSRGWDAYPLAPKVLRELQEFERTLLRQGQVNAGSARSYRKALACVVKQAQRFLGKPLTRISELYQGSLIAAVAADDQPFDQIVEQISKYTLRQRRVALRAYLKAVGLPGRTFEEAIALLDEGLRRAATKRGYRYTIDRGRPERRSYRPPPEDVEKVVAVAKTAPRSFVGARDAAALVLAQHVGLRSHSLLAIEGSDFSWRHGQLFILIKEKARLGRREVEVPSEAIPFLRRYVERFNGFGAVHGWKSRIGIGEAGSFWRGGKGRPWTYDGLLTMVRAVTRAAGVKPFGMHGLRHLRAGVLGERLTPEEAAAAGGWQNTGVFLRHYARALRKWQPELPRTEPAMRGGDDRGRGGSTDLVERRADTVSGARR